MLKIRVILKFLIYKGNKYILSCMTHLVGWYFIKLLNDDIRDKRYHRNVSTIPFNDIQKKKIQIGKNTMVMNSVLGVSHAIAQFQLSH